MSDKAIEAAAEALADADDYGVGYDVLARAAIAAYEAALWRPIEEAPKDGTLLMVWNGKNIQRAFWDKVDCAWVLAFKTTTKRKPVFPSPVNFRPLPPPPHNPDTPEA